MEEVEADTQEEEIQVAEEDSQEGQEVVFKSPTQSGFWSKNGATATATSCLYSETQKTGPKPHETGP